MAKKIIRKRRDFVEHIEAMYSLSKPQMKILAKLASMINYDDEDFKEYHFSIGQLLIDLGIGEDNYTYLRRITKDMAGKAAEFINDKGELVQTGIITAKYPKDKPILKLKIDSDLRPYFLQLKGWIAKYELKYYFRLKGKYSMRMYELFKTYQFMNSFEKNIVYLRNYISLPESKYKQNVHFRQRIIDDSIKDIEENTDIEIDYEQIKKNKKIVGFKFWIYERGTKERRKLDDRYKVPLSKPLFDGENQKIIEKDSLVMHIKSLSEVERLINLYEHYIRTGDDLLISEAKEKLPGLKEKRNVLEKHIKELEKDISNRKGNSK